MRAAWVTIMVAGLTACTVVPERAPPADPQRAYQLRQVQLGDLRDWTLQGRAAVRDGDDGTTVSLFWQQGRDTFELEMSGPFGSGRVRLAGTPDGVSLERGDERVDAHSAAALLDEALGWPVPVADLRHWVLGRTTSGNMVDIDDWGRLKFLTDGDWRLEYQEYQLVEGLYLPSRLVLERSDLRIRLVISDWTLGRPTQPSAPSRGPISSGFGD